jgi:hypothetical protein
MPLKRLRLNLKKKVKYKLMYTPKYVTLKDFPFAKANSVFSAKLTLQVNKTLYLSAGQYSYELGIGTDIRPYDATKDSALPVVVLPKSKAEMAGDVTALAALGLIIYRGVKNGSGVLYYIFGGLLGTMGGYAIGSFVGTKFFEKKYVAGSSTGATPFLPKTAGSTPTATATDIPTAINNAMPAIVSLGKKNGTVIDPVQVSTALNNVGSSLSGVDADVFTAFMQVLSQQTSGGDLQSVMQSLQSAFAPLQSKYTPAQIQASTLKVSQLMNSAVPSILPMNKPS